MLVASKQKHLAQHSDRKVIEIDQIGKVSGIEIFGIKGPTKRELQMLLLSNVIIKPQNKCNFYVSPHHCLTKAMAGPRN
jgi:uncharacterized protein YuzE